MGRVLIRLAGDERGATAIEYGLIVAIVSLAIVSALEALGISINSIFTSNFQQVDEVRRCVQVGSSCQK